MREFEELLASRRREVDKHMTLVHDLHQSALNRSKGGPIDTEHVNILKSAFLVHLYNVVESIMAKIVDEVATDTKKHKPEKWLDDLFLAWIRHRAALDMEVAPNDRLERVVAIIAEAAGRSEIGSTRVAKREGNWADKEIVGIAATLGCTLTFSEEVQQRATVHFFVDNKAPLVFVRHMRNQLAHGNLSFVDSAASLSVEQLRYLQAAVMDYMEAVVSSFVSYLDGQRFLRPPAT